jgi:hypothetical protein
MGNKLYCTFNNQDELDNLLQDSSKYGLYEFMRNKSRQTNESMDMKKIIKENLIKTSEKKQNRLLSENTIIVNRYKLLTENINPKSKKDVKKFFDLVITETAYLHSQDYNKDLIDAVNRKDNEQVDRSKRGIETLNNENKQYNPPISKSKIIDATNGIKPPFFISIYVSVLFQIIGNDFQFLYLMNPNVDLILLLHYSLVLYIFEGCKK